jgi:cytochrome c5
MSEIHIEEHSSPIKTPQQLITVVVLAFVVPIAIIVMLTQYLTTGIKLDPNGSAMTPESVAERLRPVGQLVVQSDGGTQTAKTGEQVVKAVCAACHASGALNAPKIGDSAAWGKLASTGLEHLTEQAIKGKGSMPAKGGNPALSDLEIARAIVYMANQSGQKLKEPAAPAATTAAAAAPGSGERSGEEVVKAACGKCHTTGAGGAPKIGDKTAWGPRVSKGLDAVTRSAIKGHGGMPARGGLADLTDSEVTAAILFMFLKGGGEADKAAAKPVAAKEAAVAAAPAPTVDGKAIYEKNCAACHMTGAAGAPMAGDKAAWAPRLKEGIDHLVEHAIKGKGAMPPKGGNVNLSDAEVKAAVTYLTSLAK